MSRSPYATERTLREKIRRLDEGHRKQLSAKNTEIERLRLLTNSGLRTLMASYENLELLLELLAYVVDLADPITSVAHESDFVTTADNENSRPMEGQGTQRDRDRLVLVGQWVGKLATDIENELAKGQGKVASRTVGGRQHWARACPGRGRVQPYDTEVCEFCDQTIGGHSDYEQPEWMERLTKKSRLATDSQ